MGHTPKSGLVISVLWPRFLISDHLRDVLIAMLGKHAVILLLPGTSFPILQDLLARVLGLWIIEHHKIDPMFSSTVSSCVSIFRV